MSYVARIALQDGRIVSLREPGQPQIVEKELSDGVTLIYHEPLPKVFETETDQELIELCAKHNIHAKIVEVQDC